MPETLSIACIVKNEEKSLARMLRTVSEIADEIIVTDTGSSDRTLEIARDFGAKIFYFEWTDDFSAAKNFSLAQASMDWVLFLDADEELINPQNIRPYLSDNSEKAYMLQVIHLKQEASDSSTGVNTSLRLFPNNSGYKFFGSVHEHLINPESDFQKSMISESYIRHYGFQQSKNQLVKKRIRNLRLLEKSLKSQSENDYYYYLCFLSAQEYSLLGKYKKAMEYFEKCLNYHDLDENTLINTVSSLIRVYSNLEDWDKVRNLFEKYHNIALKNPDFCLLYGIYLFEICHQSERAYQYFIMAKNFNLMSKPFIIYDLASTNWKSDYFMAMIDFQKGDYQSAKINLESARKNKENFWKINYYLIISCFKLKEYQKAKDLFRVYQSGFPEKEKQKLEKLIPDL